MKFVLEIDLPDSAKCVGCPCLEVTSTTAWQPYCLAGQRFNGGERPKWCPLVPVQGMFQNRAQRAATRWDEKLPTHYTMVCRVNDMTKFQEAIYPIFLSHFSKEGAEKIGAQAIVLAIDNMALYQMYTEFVGSAIDQDCPGLEEKLPDYEQWIEAGRPEKFDPNEDYF